MDNSEHNSTGSFYKFLLQTASSTPSQKDSSEEPAKLSRIYYLIAWLAIFFINVTVVFFSYRLMQEVFLLPDMTYLGAIGIYAFAKTLLRGILSPQ